MIIKKAVLTATAFALLALGCYGCNKGSDGNVGSTIDPQLESKTTGEPSEADFNKLLDSIAVTPLPEFKGERLKLNMLDDGVYISLVNQDCDFYCNSAFASRNFRLVTKKPVSTSKISVEIPMQNEYSFDPVLVEECRDMPFGFTYDNYMLLKDTDWRTLANLSALSNEAQKLQSAYYDSDDAEYWEDNRFSEESGREYLKYYDEYNTLSESDVPEYYVYALSVTIPKVAASSGLIDESVSELTLKIEDKAYTVNFGEWRFHSKQPDELKLNKPGVKQNAMAVVSVSTAFGADGYMNVDPGFDFTALDELMLTGLRVSGSSSELIGARVTITPDENYQTGSGEKINSSDFYWDMRMPINIPAGANVKMSVIMQDDRFNEFDFNITMFLILDYETGDRPGTLIMPCAMQAYHSGAERALASVCGVDMTDYYAYYYNAMYRTFLSEMPDSWKR